jgi:lipid A ethanolaminephosphotransferase
MLLTIAKSHSQRAIAMLALSIVLFFNVTFFAKLFSYAVNEKNYFLLISSPLILFLLLFCILNILFLLTHKMLFRALIVVLLFSSVLSSYFIDTFGTVLDQNMFINASQTDLREVLDLITPKLLIYLGLSSILSYWILFKAKLSFYSYPKEFLQKSLVIVASFILCVGVYMGVSKNYSSFFRNHHELKLYLNPYYPLASLGKFIYKEIKPKPTLKAIAADASRPSEARKKLVVFIVGETARAQNFALDGYDVPTDPLLAKRSDIVSFSNFYSCGTATAISVPCMFSKFGHDEWSSDKEYYENLVDVLAKTGVRVIWRDNNSGGDKKVAARIKDVKQYGGKSFDDVLLQDFQSNVDQAYQDTFIVLHQEGSHGPTYFKRYPDAFKRFTPTCDTQELDKCSYEQIVNTYNNTILYTDYIVNKTIDLLKANENKYDTSLIYVSDHGESLGENGIYLHGLPYMIAPDAQKHVPAVFYLGKAHAQALESLHVKKDERFSHDNLFHTILGLFDVKTKEYDAKRDMLR